METYSRIWDGKKLTATIISINESKVTYTLNDGNTIHKEYAPLFHSCFKKD